MLSEGIFKGSFSKYSEIAGKNPCTAGDHCQAGACVAGSWSMCACQANADCAAATSPGGTPDLCAGTPYCDKATLPWQPRYADLDTIVAHALAWEGRLGELRGEAQTIA